MDGKVYVGIAHGDVCVFAHGTDKQILNVVEDVGRAIFAPLVFANGTLYVATDDTLYAVRAPK